MIVAEAAHEIRIAKKVHRLPNCRRFAVLENWEHFHDHVLLYRPPRLPPLSPTLAAYLELAESLRLLAGLKIAHMRVTEHLLQGLHGPVLGGMETAVDLVQGPPKTCGAHYPPDARLFCLHAAGYPLLPVLAEICPDPAAFDHYRPLAAMADPSLALLKGWRTWDAYALAAWFREAGVAVPNCRTHFDPALRRERGDSSSPGSCGDGPR